MVRRFLWAAAVAIAVGACDGSSEPTAPDPPDGDGDGVGPDGGTVVFENLSMQIPPGALDEQVEITIERIQPESGAAGADRTVVAGTGFDLGPDGLTFAQPFQLRIAYDPGNLPEGAEESALEIFRLDDEPTALSSTVETNADEVVATADHFSAFAVAAPTDPGEPASCADLAPAATSGLPLDRVSLGPIPDGFEPPLLAEIETEGEDDAPKAFALVQVDEEDTLHLVVPVHPSGAVDGGEVRLAVTDGSGACEPFDFTIEAIEPAPGELAAIAADLQDVLDAQAVAIGTTTEELVNTPPDELPAPFVPLALVQSTLDHPDNDRSLVAIAAGESPGADELGLDLLEALLARTGLREAVETGAADAGVSVKGTDVPPASARSAANDLCEPRFVDNADLLDLCMTEARDAAREQLNPSGQLLQDLGTAFGVLGLAPGIGTAASVAGFATWLVLNDGSRSAALLPSFFTEMRLEAEPVDFFEDEEGPGNWNASVTASNAGWDMGRELLEGVLQSAAVASAFDAAAAAEGVAGPELDDVLGYILTGPVASELLENSTIEEFQIEAQTFDPVPVTDEMWTESEIALGNAVVRTSHEQYDPRATGAADLLVRTRAGRFGGAQIEASLEITVRQLDVDISPADVTATPGEEIDFEVTVTDSEHPEMVEYFQERGLEASGEPLQGSVEELIDIGGGTHVFTYTAPEDPDPTNPDLITVEHTATTGARGHSDAPRRATAAIRFGDVTISPRSGCLQPDSTLQFTAEVEGFEDETVEWSADVGDIDDSGLYTAPSSPPATGVAVITARAAADPDVMDEVGVQVGGCDCSWSVTVDGRLAESGADDGGLFIVSPDDALVVIGVHDEQTGQFVDLTATLAGATEIAPVGTIGGFPIGLLGDLTLGSDDLQYFTMEDDLPALSLTINDGNVVAGSVIGTVHIQSLSDPENPRPASFTASFRIESEDSAVDPVSGQETHSCLVDP